MCLSKSFFSLQTPVSHTEVVSQESVFLDIVQFKTFEKEQKLEEFHFFILSLILIWFFYCCHILSYLIEYSSNLSDLLSFQSTVSIVLEC